MDIQILKKVFLLLCSIPPDTNLRLMLQLSLAAQIPAEKRAALFGQIQSDRPLEKLLVDDNILTHLLEADGELGEAEDNMLLDAMDSIGLVVPSDLSGADMLIEELSKNLIAEITELQTTGTIKETPLVW